jgi:hypothetical protein
MAKVKNLSVLVSYRVGLCDVEVPDNILAELEELENFIHIDINDVEYEDSLEWLNSNIKEKDAIDWSYEIEDITK